MEPERQRPLRHQVEAPQPGVPTECNIIEVTFGQIPEVQPGPALPRWNAERRELCCGVHLVKRFRVPAPNQELILAAFEEEGWPEKLDDPLPVHPDVDARERLHETIRSLNQNHALKVIQFRGDGTGRGVCWESARARIAEAFQPSSNGSKSIVTK